jgi:hypothetical protein
MVRLVYKGINRLSYYLWQIVPVLSSGLGSIRGVFRRFFINNEERNAIIEKACVWECEGLL